MALPTTSLSFSALQTEFGGSNPISLGEYRRGGPYVPSGTTSAYGTIPTSNSNINMGVFRGTQKAVPITISISNDYIAADAVYESDFDFNTTTYTLSRGGFIIASYTSTNGGGTNGSTSYSSWVTPQSETNAALYEVRAIKVSGDAFQPTGSALNTWLPLTSDRGWDLQLTGIGRFDCVLTVQIRDAATQTIQDTATITMMTKNQN
jgi:hypothetical protein